MMKAFFSRSLMALVAVIGLAVNAQAETLRTIRIGVPDQSAGSQPFIEGPVGMAFIRHQLEEVFKTAGGGSAVAVFQGGRPGGE
ncbi:alkanesulfonates-binding protein [Klebsiella variicola]|nr:alkanesulfonates-binding protein [Klebsiella variicola]